MKKPLFISLLGVFLIGTGINANATNIFNWGVETDKTSVSTSNSLGFFGGTSRSSTTAHSGKYSMKMVVHGNDSGNQQMGAEIADWVRTPYNVVGAPAIYYRWWMKIMPGFSWGNGTAKAKSSRIIGTNHPRVYTSYVRASGFEIEECDDVGPSQSGGGCDFGRLLIPYDMRSMDDGKWHEYIVMVKSNSTTSSKDGEFKAWIDGTLVGQRSGFILHNKANNGLNEAWGGWMTRPYFQLNGTSSDGGIIYVDDFSTDTNWNSTYTNQPSSNGSTASSPPLPPSNIN